MMFSFLSTFTIFALILAFWGVLSLSFLFERVRLSQVELLTAARYGIVPQDVLGLVRDGRSGFLDVAGDLRYARIMEWLDVIHQMRPSARPYIFVPGSSKGEILYVADIYSKYHKDLAWVFLQADTLDSTDDYNYRDDFYFKLNKNLLFVVLDNRFKDVLEGTDLTQKLRIMLDVFSSQITSYVYLRDAAGSPVVGIGIQEDNILRNSLNSQILSVLVYSFMTSLFLLLLVGLRTAHVVTHSIRHLNLATEMISAGDNKAGLEKLDSNFRPGFSIDEVGRLADTIRSLVDLQQTVYTISSTATSTTDLTTLYATIYLEVKKLIRANDFSLALFNEDSQKIQVFSARVKAGVISEVVTHDRSIENPPDLIAYVIQTGQALVLDDQGYKKLVRKSLIRNGDFPGAWLGVPLFSTENKLIGALVARSSTARFHFSQNDKNLLVFIASQLAVIIKRAQMQTELRQSYQLLEQRVQDRTSDLQEANLLLEKEIGEREQAEIELLKAKDAAEAANLAKSAFLANMSHELRTPLNAILGFSNLMSHDPSLPPGQKEDLGIILQSGEHLLDLVNDVLDLSKIESGRMVLNPSSFDLYRMLDEVEEVFHVRAAEKGLTLMAEPAPNLPRYIFSDEKKLRQILFNILSNAVKFTKQGGITLRSRVLEPTDPEKIQLSFEVEDTGPGIPAEQIQDLFDYFVQTDAGKNSLEGTGLGLSICKNFVHMLGGDIRVISEPGRGSTFIFDITARLSTSEEIVNRPRERRVIDLEAGQRGWRILVAEDREANRKLLVKLLQPFMTNSQRPGFEIREAVNGRQAVQIWEEWEPDLIFMDMRMPEMNGHQATQIIRASIKGQAVKIIALTASAFEEERQVILSEGIDDFIRKPFKEHEIFNVLSKHLDDIHFIYAEAEFSSSAPGEAPGAVSLEPMPGLPAAWLERLKYAAAAADAEQIHELLQEIVLDFPAQAGSLGNLVRQYRFDLILSFVEAQHV